MGKEFRFVPNSEQTPSKSYGSTRTRSVAYVPHSIPIEQVEPVRMMQRAKFELEWLRVLAIAVFLTVRVTPSILFAQDFQSGGLLRLIRQDDLLEVSLSQTCLEAHRRSLF
jgi:hypothetical protein